MDASLANDINRRDARLIAERFDEIVRVWPALGEWAEGSIADTLMSEDAARASDRAWLVGALAACTPGLYFDGDPADCDWENLYSHLRAEILVRRALNPPCVRAPETPGAMVV